MSSRWARAALSHRICTGLPPRRLGNLIGELAGPWAAQRFDWDEELLGKLAAERRSRVTFDIEPAGQMVKLTVVHDGFEPGSTMADMVKHGWPEVIASLKTLLETGEAVLV